MRESETLPRGIHIHERFKLGALRARGGMATIYEGTEIPTERHVAIKFLRTDLAKNPDMVAMFRDEGAIVTRLDHPNIIRGLASGVHGGSHYIVMEFVSGPTLRERLKWGMPEKDEALSILRQAAAGLDHAHDRGVVHRDIKPDNFILEKSVVRLGDFGIAQVSRKEEGKEGSALGGTVIYSAPEQFEEGVTVDRRADVYSLGIVAYEMFTGRTPFTGYKPASTISHRVPKAADEVLERAFHENPAERYPTAGAFFAALEATFKTFAPESTPSPRPDPGTTPLPVKPQPAPVVAAPPEVERVEDSQSSSLVKWLVLAVVLVAAGILAAKILAVGPFAKASGESHAGLPRVKSSRARDPVTTKAPFVTAVFPRDEAAPPAPAGLLEDRVTIALIDSQPVEVESVALEARARRTCENAWENTVHEYVEGEAVGDLILFDRMHPLGRPRLAQTRFEFGPGNNPLRLHIELQSPAAQIDLDLVAGTGTIALAGGKPRAGTCRLQPK